MRTLALLGTVALGLGCSLAVGSDFNPLGFYIGIAGGRSDVKTTVDVPSTLPVVVPESSFDERATAWKVLVGSRPIRMFAVEVAYVDFGHSNNAVYLGNDVDAGFVSQSHVLQRAPTLSGLLYLPIPVPILDIYGRAGVARLETHGTTQIVCSGFCPPTISPMQINRTNTDFLYGAGVQLKFAALAVRLEYELINDSRGDPDLLSAGLTWTF
jgi:opacity protein-like surface antigen